MDIERAEDFCRSYDRAMRAYDAKAIAGHYAEPYAVFTLGARHAVETRAEALDGVGGQLGAAEGAGACGYPPGTLRGRSCVGCGGALQPHLGGLPKDGSRGSPSS